MKLLHGDRAAQFVSERIARPEQNLSTLKQIPANRRVEGMVCYILEGDAANTRWMWEQNSTVTGDDILAAKPLDNPSTGRWMRVPGYAMLKLPIYATTPTGTNLLTVPSNTILKLDEFAWVASAVFTGASNAALAVSSTNHPGHTGIGNLLPSAVATNLNHMFSGTANGTGLQFNMGMVASGTFDSITNKRPWMKGGDTIRLDVIGAQFATGAGAVLMACEILQNPGV